MEDAGRWFVRDRGAQSCREPIFVRSGKRQPEDLVSMPACGERVG